MTYDQKCYELATAFLAKTPHLDTTDRAEKLERWIRHAAEAWIEIENENYEPPDPPGFEAGFAENH